MAVEAAFLKAIEANPRSQLVKRVRRAIHKGQHGREESPSAAVWDPRAFSHAAHQLGKKWAAYRLGGCAWMGPAEKLTAEWQRLNAEAGERQKTGARVILLTELFSGIGLGKRPLDRCGRDYLFRVLESTPAGWAYLCRLEGVRWFSPLTVLVEAVHDLAGHTFDDKEDLREHLGSCLAPVDDVVGPEVLHRLAAAIVSWMDPPP